MEDPNDRDIALEKMKEVVVQLMQHKDASPFLEPVDWKELELFDYPVIVKTPMDLGTVQRNLEEKAYETAAACAQDIRLIWSNCMEYNTEGSEFWVLGKAFKRRFEDKYRKIKYEYDVGEEPEDDYVTSSNHRVPQEEEVVEENEEEEEDEPSTSDTLADQLLRLTQSQLGKIVQRVQRECPDALKFPLPEMLELETENLSDDIIQQIAAFSQEQPRARKRGPTIRYVNTTKRSKKKDTSTSYD